MAMEAVKKNLRMKRQEDILKNSKSDNSSMASSYNSSIERVVIDDGTKWVDATIDQIKSLSVDDLLTAKVRIVFKILFDKKLFYFVTLSKDADGIKMKNPEATVILLPQVLAWFDSDLKPEALKDMLMVIQITGGLIGGLTTKSVEYGKN